MEGVKLTAFCEASLEIFSLQRLSEILNGKLYLRSILGVNTKIIDDSLLCIDLIHLSAGAVLRPQTNKSHLLVNGEIEISKKFFIKSVVGETKYSFLDAEPICKHRLKLTKMISLVNGNPRKQMELATALPECFLLETDMFEFISKSDVTTLIEFNISETINMPNKTKVGTEWKLLIENLEEVYKSQVIDILRALLKLKKRKITSKNIVLKAEVLDPTKEKQLLAEKKTQSAAQKSESRRRGNAADFVISGNLKLSKNSHFVERSFKKQNVNIIAK